MSSLIQYLRDTRTELKHVAWPTQQQTIVFTALVIIISIVLAFYVGFFDFIFTQALERGIELYVGDTPVAPQAFPALDTATATPEIDVDFSVTGGEN